MQGNFYALLSLSVATRFISFVNSQICTSGADNDVVAEWLEPWFRYFATAYLEIVKKQTGPNKKEFFGLRDFYR